MVEKKCAIARGTSKICCLHVLKNFVAEHKSANFEVGKWLQLSGT